MTDIPPETEGVEVGNPAGYIRGLIGEGYSARAGLEAFRGEGGAIRDSRWYALYGQVSDTLARQSEVAGLDPNVIPGPGDYGEWEMGRGGQYATQVSVHVIDRETDLWTTRQYTYVTSDPHTPAEAEAAAMDEFGDPDVESEYGETVYGAIANGLWITRPYGGS